MIHQKMCEFITDMMTTHPDRLPEIAEALTTALATVVKAGSLNHSETMRSQSDDVVDHLTMILDESIEAAAHEEATTRPN